MWRTCKCCGLRGDGVRRGWTNGDLVPVVALGGRVRDDVELAWKRGMAEPRGAAAGLLVSTAGLIGSWWLAARLLLPEYRPELLGVDRGGDVPHPQEWAFFSTAFLGSVGVAFAVSLALGSQRPRGARKMAGAIVVAGLLLVGGAIAIRAEPRCSFESYTGETTCASRSEVLLTDLGMIVLPGILAVGCIALGPGRDRRDPRDRR